MRPIIPKEMHYEMYYHSYYIKNNEKCHGEIILERRLVGKCHLNDWTMCQTVNLWVSKIPLNTHQHSCNAKKLFITNFSLLITQSDSLSRRITALVSKPLVNEVFTKIKMDIVGKLAGSSSLESVGAFNLRKLKPLPDPCLSSCLKSEHFDTVCQATILTRAVNMVDEEDLLKPSYAVKIGFELKRLGK
jgi:hypothetical protein